MRYSRLLFETPIPDSAMLRVSEAWTPKLGTTIMDWLFIPVLLPPHTMYQSSLRAYCANKLLFIRGHALRMPAHLLIRHLSFKAFVAPFIKEKSHQADLCSDGSLPISPLSSPIISVAAVMM